MNISRGLLVGIALIFWGCPSSQQDDDDSAQEGPADSVEYYYGDSFATLPGAPEGQETVSTYLVRRSLFPGQSRITEELIPTGGGEHYLVTMEVDAEAATLELEFQDGSYTGTGTLIGPPWAWTGWQTQSTSTVDGSTVTSTDVLGETALIVDKVVRDPAGNPVLLLHEEFEVMSQSAWQEIHDQVPAGR